VPDPNEPSRMLPLKALVSRFHGTKAIGMHLHDAFSYPSYILGMANLFVLMYEDPDLVSEIVAASVDHSVEMIRNAAREGADFIVLGDDYGGKSGPMMSPAHFERFFLPGMARVVKEAKRVGLYVIKHTDGNIYSILQQMVSTGIDAFHPSDPGAGMDIVKVKALYGDRICVVGGIDTGDPLSYWNVDELISEVRRRIRELAPGGGWIISSSNTVHASAKPENYGALVWATRTYGQYSNLDQHQPVPGLESVLHYS
jgi:uroporphyrinogen decarboxylase